jgi:hypothetical protein
MPAGSSVTTRTLLSGQRTSRYSRIAVLVLPGVSKVSDTRPSEYRPIQPVASECWDSDDDAPNGEPSELPSPLDADAIPTVEETRARTRGDPMLCSSCKQTLPKRGNFCVRCGPKVSAPMSPHPIPPPWIWIAAAIFVLLFVRLSFFGITIWRRILVKR